MLSFAPSRTEICFVYPELGLSTDIWTCYGARIMLISLLPFVIVQLPQAFHTQEGNLAVLVSLTVAIVLLISYSLYQVFQPWIQKRKIAYSKHKQLISGVLKQLKAKTLGRLFMDNGQPNVDAIQKLFEVMDENTDGYLTAKELRALVIGIQLEDGHMDVDNAVYHVLKEFDTSNDSFIDKNEFIQGVSRWLEKAKNSALYGHRSLTTKLLIDFEEYTKKEQDILGGQSEDTKSPQSIGWDGAKAGLLLLSGTLIAAVIAEPLVDAVNNFSSASNIPSFFVSFVILPFASSSEIVSILIFASKKNMRSASLAYSEIYGSVTMSNILSLSVFLGLVYCRDLTWNFSAEVLIILVVCITMGLIGSFRTKFPIWMCFVAFGLYPISLFLAYILDYVVGWA
ncbi:Sodium/calcium exchanger NCL1 [Linum grandiflorum]